MSWLELLGVSDGPAEALMMYASKETLVQRILGCDYRWVMRWANADCFTVQVESISWRWASRDERLQPSLIGEESRGDMAQLT